MEVSHHKLSCPAQTCYIRHRVFIGVHPHAHLQMLTASNLHHSPHSLPSSANILPSLSPSPIPFLPSSVYFCCLTSLSVTMSHLSLLNYTPSLPSRCPVECQRGEGGKTLCWEKLLHQITVFLGFFFVFVFLAHHQVVTNVVVSCEQRKSRPSLTEILTVRSCCTTVEKVANVICQTHTLVSEYHPSPSLYSIYSLATTNSCRYF